MPTRDVVTRDAGVSRCRAAVASGPGGGLSLVMVEVYERADGVLDDKRAEVLAAVQRIAAPRGLQEGRDFVVVASGRPVELGPGASQSLDQSAGGGFHKEKKDSTGCIVT